MFHSQQAAEKAAKSFLAHLLEPALSPLLQQAADLNAYAVVFRYVNQRRSALETAERVFTVLSTLVYPSTE